MQLTRSLTEGGPDTDIDPATPTRPRSTLVTIAAWASLGAGSIHAAAIGIHGEHREAALVFLAVAAFQILWGVIALASPGPLVALTGATGNTALIGGYFLSKTNGIGFVDGLEAAEAGQVPDTVAAGLAGVVVVLGLAACLPGLMAIGRRPLPRLPATAGSIAVVGLTLWALVSATVSPHDHGVDAHTQAAAHPHGPESGTVDGEQTSAVVAPTPYDPTKPIDLGGVPGVTPEQQAAAENLVAVTLLRLPRFADTTSAEAAGFNSIGDAATGYEHYINWDAIDDEYILDPDHPESLVYRVENSERRLVSAMFMLPQGTSLQDVPELGGALTQWHIHDDLCFSDDSDAARLAAVIAVGGECSAPLVKFDPVPMIHVWITPHECGPFASLEGVGAGQIAEDEERLCDHAHGA